MTAIYCSKKFSPQKLTIIEGSDLQIDKITNNLKNNVVNDVLVMHATVGDNIGIYKNKKVGNYIDINSLTDYDYIEMDIEGSEHSLLKNLQIRPEYLVVEFHPTALTNYSYLWEFESIYKIIRLTSETHNEINPSTKQIIEELEANKITHAIFNRI